MIQLDVEMNTKKKVNALSIVVQPELNIYI